MLEKFRQIKLREIEKLGTQAENGMFPPPWAGIRPSFADALLQKNGLPAVIAEYKRASPSKGPICDSVQAEQAALEYMQNGANALSILTEEQYFNGKFEYLDKAHNACAHFNAPILRKDFIFHPLQIYKTASSPASALLLIVRLSPDALFLRKLQEEAAKYGMATVVEIFDETELAIARDSGAELIQVNARNLNNLEVNDNACINLINKCPPLSQEKWIAASGINQGRQLRQAAEAGYCAVLIGSFLMTGGKPGPRLHQLIQDAKNAS